MLFMFMCMFVFMFMFVFLFGNPSLVRELRERTAIKGWSRALLPQFIAIGYS